MSRTVVFKIGNAPYNSEGYFDSMFIGKTVEIPKPRIITVDIPGRNGKLDLTDALTGSACFEDFTVTLNFMFNSRDEATVKTKLERFCDILNGKNATASIAGVFSYSGRCTVQNFRNENLLWFVDVEINCLNPANGRGFS